MNTGLPVWLEVPAFIIAVVLGHVFLGWLLGKFRFNKRQ